MAHQLPAGQLKGHLFEYIEAAAVQRAGRLGACRFSGENHCRRRPSHAPADIEIVKGKEVIKEIQAKASDDPNWIATKQGRSQIRRHGSLGTQGSSGQGAGRSRNSVLGTWKRKETPLLRFGGIRPKGLRRR